MTIGEIRLQNGKRSGEDQMKLAERRLGTFLLATVICRFLVGYLEVVDPKFRVRGG